MSEEDLLKTSVAGKESICHNFTASELLVQVKKVACPVQG